MNVEHVPCDLLDRWIATADQIRMKPWVPALNAQVGAVVAPYAESRSVVACLLRSILVNTNIVAFAGSFEGMHHIKPGLCVTILAGFACRAVPGRSRGETAVFRWAVAL